MVPQPHRAAGRTWERAAAGHRHAGRHRRGPGFDVAGVKVGDAVVTGDTAEVPVMELARGHFRRHGDAADPRDDHEGRGTPMTSAQRDSLLQGLQGLRPGTCPGPADPASSTSRGPGTVPGGLSPGPVAGSRAAAGLRPWITARAPGPGAVIACLVVASTAPAPRPSRPPTRRSSTERRSPHRPRPLRRSLGSHRSGRSSTGSRGSRSRHSRSASGHTTTCRPRRSRPCRPTPTPRASRSRLVGCRLVYNPVTVAQRAIANLEGYERTGDPEYQRRARAAADVFRRVGVRVGGALYLPYTYDFALHGIRPGSSTRSGTGDGPGPGPDAALPPVRPGTIRPTSPRPASLFGSLQHIGRGRRPGSRGSMRPATCGSRVCRAAPGAHAQRVRLRNLWTVRLLRRDPGSERSTACAGRSRRSRPT